MTRKPTPEEKDLWIKAIQGVKPLTKKTIPQTPPPSVTPAKIIEKRRFEELYEHISQPTHHTTSSKRIRSQKVIVEGRLDLHGLTMSQAEDTLRRFLFHAQHARKKWVLVITGKGSPDNENSLRKKVPFWLDALSLVSAYSVAKSKDGGEGALYVRLKNMDSFIP